MFVSLTFILFWYLACDCDCLQVAGDQDPYSSLHVQQELFSNLGRGSDRTWSILADADHAVHLLEGRHRFTDVVASFILNGKRSEQIDHSSSTIGSNVEYVSQR
jgi:pimeloyl-ACP methyl ester carboxylesterase